MDKKAAVHLSSGMLLSAIKKKEEEEEEEKKKRKSKLLQQHGHTCRGIIFNEVSERKTNTT